MAWPIDHASRSARALRRGAGAPARRHQSHHRFSAIDSMASRIEDYALIGNCEAAALVGRDGSIDWLCWPRFDCDACFAALVGDSEHGRWQIAPRNKATVTRRYRGHSLILETRFVTDEGAVLLVDFMPLGGGHSS